VIDYDPLFPREVAVRLPEDVLLLAVVFVFDWKDSRFHTPSSCFSTSETRIRMVAFLRVTTVSQCTQYAGACTSTASGLPRPSRPT
jgi:hypothetical protein